MSITINLLHAPIPPLTGQVGQAARRNYPWFAGVGFFESFRWAIFQHNITGQMLRSKDEWKAEAESMLPPREKIIQRNRAITAHYARLYLDHHEIFKWAGMAAFASSQVGIALAFVELLQSPGKMIQKREVPGQQDFGSYLGHLAGEVVRSLFSLPVSIYDAAVRQALLNDLEEVRNGNNNIYNDIAWAHEAYLEGGLEELAVNTDEREKEFMLEGFRMIDEGKQLLDSDPVRARALIREGNVNLLRHEQVNTLPPVFEAISPLGRIVVSFGSELNFAGAAPAGLPDRASFAEHAGYVEVLSGMRSVTNSEHRWQWIEAQVLPVWNAIDRSSQDSHHLAACLGEMADGKTSMLQPIARFASTMSFLPGIGR